MPNPRIIKNKYGDEFHMEKDIDDTIGITWYTKEGNNLIEETNMRIPKEAFNDLLELMTT